MFGAKGKTGSAIKKARASTPPGGNRAGMASSSPGGDPDSASTSKAPARRVVNGVTALKFIPFSMTEFENSLTENQRRLLQLEIETLGKSWYASVY